jgi:NADH:ubiquinone oxidoreductase subunit 2 (subunit N)
MLFTVILIGLFLKNTGNHIKILNITSALLFTEYLISYGYDNFFVINLTQNFTYFAHLFIYITLIIAILFFLSISQKNFFKENTKVEFTLLIWCIIIASQYLISSLDFISIIILLECIAFSSYVLVGFERKNKFSVTSGLQYLILASIPGGLFILGIVLFYNNFGTFSYEYLNLLLDGTIENFFNKNNSVQNWDIIFQTNINAFWLLNNKYSFLEIQNFNQTDSFIFQNNIPLEIYSNGSITDVFNLTYINIYIYIYLALLFIIANLSFKLTAAPFHFWAPSVYGGSPLITLTFLSIFSKTIFIFFSIWLFANILDSLSNIWQFLIIIIAFLSILTSIIGAFSEKIFKRFFVYSSTGHVGFMLLGITTLNISGLKGTLDYLILYILSSFIVWFIIMHLTKKTVTLINLKGLSYNQPYLSLIFSIILFSLSGIPPLGGFFVKYEIFYSLINSSFFLLAYLLLLLTIISFFYYLRLIKIFYFENNKKLYKFKNFNDIKLRLISYSFFIIPFFILFSDNSISSLITNILIKSLF